MTVYVDAIVDYGSPAPGKDVKHADATTYPRCHLWADSEAELNAFARLLHLPLGWKQRRPTEPRAHFDLSPDWRQRAVRKGAQETTLQDWFRKRRLHAHET